MKPIIEYVKQASNFHFPHVVNEYLSAKVVQTKIKATNETIYKIVKSELDRLGHDADLNHIDVSEVTDATHLFNPNKIGGTFNPHYKDINPDVSKWDVSNIQKMQYMFACCEKFNKDISKWNISNVHTTEAMFFRCEKFNCDISGWDISNVKNMNSMFSHCFVFNQPIGCWDMSNVDEMFGMFSNCKNFVQDLSGWKISSKYRNPETMFEFCPLINKKEYLPNFI